MAKYRIRLDLDTGSGTLFWADNEAAIERWGYAIDPDDLPLTQNSAKRARYLAAWWDTCIDWSHPGGASPWSPEEKARFFSALVAFLPVVRRELGDEVEVLDGTSPYRDV
jgi:hypothetical protein